MAEYYSGTICWKDKQNEIMVNGFYESKRFKRDKYSYTIRFASQYISESKSRLLIYVIHAKSSFNERIATPSSPDILIYF